MKAIEENPMDNELLQSVEDEEEEEQIEEKSHDAHFSKPWHWKGILFAVGSAIVLHLSKFLGKEALIRTSLLSYEISYYQALIVSVLLLGTPLCFKSVSFLNLGRSVQIPLYLQSLISAAISISLYMAIDMIPYSEAIMLSYTKPMFGVIAARIYLRERITFVDFLALITCLLAIYFYIDPGNLLSTHNKGDFKNGEDPGDIMGIILALVTGILGGLEIICFRQLERLNAHVFVQTFYGGIFGLLLAPIFIIPAQENSPKEPQYTVLGIVFLVLMGLAYLVGQILLDKAYHQESATRVLMMMYLEVLIAIVLEVAVFESKLKWTDYVAAALIFLSLIAVALRRK